MGGELADVVIERHAKRLGGKARRITIDLDPTDDPTHGAQQRSFFNGHYDCFCFLPMVGTLQFNDERDQYLFTVVLRPGNAHCTRGAIGILMRTISRLRDAFPKTRIRTRLDGGFAPPDIFDYLEFERIEYLVGFAGNAALETQIANHRLLKPYSMHKTRSNIEDSHFWPPYPARPWHFCALTGLLGAIHE